MIEGTRIRITNPKTFLEGTEGHILGKVRPGLYRIQTDDQLKTNMLLMGNEFEVIEPDLRQPNFD